MLTIARMAIKEVLSKKIFYLVLVMTIVFFLGYAMVLHYLLKSLDPAGPGPDITKATTVPMFLSLALYFSTFIVALTAIFSTVNAISGEIESGTIQAVITKPIKRSDFLLGKFFGYALMVVSYSVVLFIGVIAITGFMTGYQTGGTLNALGFFVLIPLVLLALSFWGSSFLSTLANGIFLCLLFIIGTVGGMVEQIGSILEKTALMNMGIVASFFIPTDAIYRKMVFGLMSGPDNPIDVFSFNPFACRYPPSSLMVIYAVLYLIVFLHAAVRKFNRRDI